MSMRSPVGKWTRDAALDARHHQVLEADVGERAAHHHLVVAAPRAVGVEVLLRDAAAPSGSARPGCPRAMSPAGRDVVGGHRVAEHRQHARALDVAERRRLRREALEERRLLDVGRLASHSKRSPSGDRDRVPGRVAVEHVARSSRANISPADRAPRASRDLLLRRPDVAQAAPACRRCPLPSGSCVEVDVGRCRPAHRPPPAAARRGSWPCTSRVHAALEVAVAREHRRGHQLALVRPPSTTGSGSGPLLPMQVVQP